MKIVFTAIAMALITSGCSHQPAPEINSKPYDPQQTLTSIFRGNLDAVDRGQLLIQAMKQNSPQTNFDLFLGLDVAFVGGGAPPGGNADLREWHSPEYRIQVVLHPDIDVRPMAAFWRSAVLGRVKHIDVEKKVITLDVDPKYWVVLVAM